MIDLDDDLLCDPCGDCGAVMTLLPREYGDRGLYWRCTRFPECRGTVGAHPNGKPLGKPANAETREWRRRAHVAFDALWEHDTAPFEQRHEAYSWMRGALRITKDEAHIAMFDADMCRRLIGACRAPTFEVRWIDAHERKFVFVTSEWLFTTAALVADALSTTGDDHVVIDRMTKQVVYDSRRLRPLPLSSETTLDEARTALAELLATRCRFPP